MDTEKFNQSKAHLESIGFRHDFGFNFKRGCVALQWEKDHWHGWTTDGVTVWHSEYLPTK